MERGDSGGVVKAPVLVVDGVEPDESEQAIQANAREEVSHLCRLVRSWRYGRFCDEDGVVSQLTHGSNGWPEKGCERPRRFVVITVHAHPRYVLISGPPGCWTGNAAARVHDVGCPEPGHVSDPKLAKQCHDVSPSGHESLG